MHTSFLHRLGFRFADLCCSAAAFLAANAVLGWTRSFASSVLQDHAALTTALSPTSPGSLLPSWGQLAWIGIIVTLTSALVLEYTGDAKPLHTRTNRDVLMRLSLSMLAAVGAVATVFYALRTPPSSRLFVAEYVLLFFLLMAAYRLIVRRIQVRRHKAGHGAPQVILAGSRAGIERYIRRTATSPASVMKVAGCLIVNGHSEPPLAGFGVLGRIEDLGDLLIHQPIDEVILILPSGPSDWLPEVVRHCDYFRIALQIVDERLIDIELCDLREASAVGPAPSIRFMPEEDLTSPMLVWKRTMDIVVSFTALVALLPVFVVIAIGIKITSPRLPVIYSWSWVGYHGRRFRGHKFTTMIADAETRKDALAAQNEMSGPVFKIRNDPRVTPFGRFLRKYSLNELPQLWSVLIGDMSLVGPRPALPRELVRYELWHKRKLSVQPGITCFWQVRGRNAISNFDDWVKMDLEYIQKRSFRTDVSILLRTIPAVLRGTGC